MTIISLERLEVTSSKGAIEIPAPTEVHSNFESSEALKLGFWFLQERERMTLHITSKHAVLVQIPVHYDPHH